MKTLLRNGVLAGLGAGATLAVVLVALGERAIGRAVELEGAGTTGAHDEMFTRSAQTAGGVLGALMYGAVLGVVFAVAFTVLRHRLPAATDFRRSVVLAAVGWLATVGVPFVLYPPNPPGIGDASSVGRRTVAYLLAIAWGLGAVAASARAGRQLSERGRSEAAVGAASLLLFVALVVVAALLFPARLSAGPLPADLVWDFRLTSLAGTTACWAALGLAFGALPVSRQEDLVHA